MYCIRSSSRDIPHMTDEIEVWHNILWSQYKGAVFTELNKLACEGDVRIRFFQIAETENDRIGLAAVDLSRHQYPFELIAKGSYDEIPTLWLIITLFKRAITSKAQTIVIAGYHRIEYFAQLLGARLSGKQVFVFCDATSQDRPRSRLRGAAKRLFFFGCTGVFCYGARSRDYLLTLGVDPQRIFTRRQAAALPRDYDGDHAATRRIAAQGETKHPVILYVGRLSPEKNTATLVDAFVRLLPHYPRARLRIVGTGPQGADLLRAVKERGIEAKVEFAGGMSGSLLYDEYARARVLVLPSFSEPWGLVVNEALAFGCPVLASDRCGCVPELIDHIATGHCFNPNDSAELCAILERMLQPDWHTRERVEARIERVRAFNPVTAAREMFIPLEAHSRARVRAGT